MNDDDDAGPDDANRQFAKTVDARSAAQQPSASPALNTPVDSHAVQAGFPVAHLPATASEHRRLAPPSSAAPVVGTGGHEHDRAVTRPRRFADIGLPVSSIYTVLWALAIVIGLFLVCAWLLRRRGKITINALPADVVSVLGRVPLSSRHFAQLLRVGNKLVLVLLTPAGAEPIAEVTDPAEVDRIVGLCQQLDPHSATREFEHVFRQLSREPAPGGFLGSEFALPALSPRMETHRSRQGDAARV
jgi:flagellar biogenesis protein FliO